MSVTTYNSNKPHPGGFIGHRVAVMVGENHKQRYFSTSKGQTGQFTLAHKLNAKWLQEKEKFSSYFRNQAVQTSRSVYSTGVRGISKKYVWSNDRQGKPKYKHYRYIVQVANNGKNFHRGFPVTESGWFKAVKFLAVSKGLTRWKHLLKRQTF